MTPEDITQLKDQIKAEIRVETNSIKAALEGQMGRINTHLSEMKGQHEAFGSTLKDIASGLNGNDFGGIGLVGRVKRIDERLEEIERHDQVVQVYVRQSKFVIGGLVLSLIGLILKEIWL